MYIVPGAQSCEYHHHIRPCNLFTQSTDHEWKHGFFLNCLTPVLTTAISAQPQPYHKILDVDKDIRDFTVPPTLDIFNVDGIHDNRQLTMQQVLVSSGREIGVFDRRMLRVGAADTTTASSSPVAQKFFYRGLERLRCILLSTQVRTISRRDLS